MCGCVCRRGGVHRIRVPCPSVRASVRSVGEGGVGGTFLTSAAGKVLDRITFQRVAKSFFG